jgi:hypothetical protein
VETGGAGLGRLTDVEDGATTFVTVDREILALLEETGAGAGAAAALPEETAIGLPPLEAPPLKETTRVDRIGVFPPCERLEPSCSGMISLLWPLSRTI